MFKLKHQEFTFFASVSAANKEWDMWLNFIFKLLIPSFKLQQLIKSTVVLELFL